MHPTHSPKSSKSLIFLISIIHVAISLANPQIAPKYSNIMSHKPAQNFPNSKHSKTTPLTLTNLRKSTHHKNQQKIRKLLPIQFKQNRFFSKLETCFYSKTSMPFQNQNSDNSDSLCLDIVNVDDLLMVVPIYISQALSRKGANFYISSYSESETLNIHITIIITVIIITHLRYVIIYSLSLNFIHLD